MTALQEKASPELQNVARFFSLDAHPIANKRFTSPENFRLAKDEHFADVGADALEYSKQR